MRPDRVITRARRRLRCQRLALGGPDGQFDEATDINNQGQVVGFSSLPGNVFFHGFFWDRHSGMQDLGTVPGDSYSVAVRVNNSGDVVGLSCEVTGTICRAALWHGGVAKDLNTLINGSPLFRLEAFGINSRAQIVGAGVTATGDLHAFLATPESAGLGSRRRSILRGFGFLTRARRWERASGRVGMRERRGRRAE
jgi:probable HAF family extracellular repeat protein